MECIDRPAREARTLQTEAAYVLTELQALFIEFATSSKTWPEGSDPSAFFENDIFKKIQACPDLDADSERDAFFMEMDNLEAGKWYEPGLAEMLWIATAYCVNAMNMDRQGIKAVAWTLMIDASYWLGILKTRFNANCLEVEMVKSRLSERSSPGGIARAKKIADAEQLVLAKVAEIDGHEAKSADELAGDILGLSGISFSHRKIADTIRKHRKKQGALHPAQDA